jgi:Putative prokaryotic signal transducing protein
MLPEQDAMKILKSFSTAEDAYLAAALLESAGVESSVLDDRGLGGNMLGMTSKHGVRLEVADEDFEQAREIVQ